MTAAPKSWIKQLTHLADQAREIPMWGNTPSFPWDDFTQKLKERFHWEKCHIAKARGEWKKPDEFYQELGVDPIALAISLSPLKTPCFLLLPTEELGTLTAKLSTQDSGEKGIIDLELQKGILDFFALELLSLTDRLQVYSTLSLKLTQADIPPEEGYLLDITTEIEGKSFHPKLLIPASLHNELKTHFTSLSPTKRLEILEQVDVPLSLHVGQVELSQQEWKSLQVGDFMILDHCTYHVEEKKGIAEVCFHTRPLYQARLKEGKLKILDYAHVYEERPMAESPPSNPSDEERPPEEENETGEELENLHTKPPEEMLSPSEISVNVVVEVGRMNMSVEKLSSLTPGNVIDLGISPEQGVSLTVEGKLVGRGELVQVGDVIGVKINELG